MADISFSRINDDLRLAYDELQWILQRHKGVRKSGAQAGEDMWRAVSFVSSTRAVLASCMRDAGISEADARTVLDTLPDTFREFIQDRQSGGREAAHSPIEGLPGPDVAEDDSAAVPSTLRLARAI